MSGLDVAHGSAQPLQVLVCTLGQVVHHENERGMELDLAHGSFASLRKIGARPPRKTPPPRVGSV